MSSSSEDDSEFVRSLQKRREARAARREAAKAKIRKERKKKKVVVDSSSSEESIMKKRRKKKKLAFFTSSESSEEEKGRQKRGKKRKTETESSQEEGDVDNWTKLAPLWPVEQRPKVLQCRATVNSHSMKELMKMEKLYRSQDKKNKIPRVDFLPYANGGARGVLGPDADEQGAYLPAHPYEALWGRECSE